jgi:transposase-like protein
MSMAQPFYCPYCGEQEIRPGESVGTFVCEICTRTWKLDYLGTGTGEGA